MSEQLEKWARENRELLDQENPPKGHAERFATKLQAVERGNGPLSWTWAAAAVVAVLIAVSFLLGRSGPGDLSGSLETTFHGLASVSGEMAEVEEHFAQEVAMKMEYMRSLDRITNSELALNNFRILKQLEEEYEVLKTDLEENPKDQRIINSMIMNYRLRIKVMDKMLNKLESINNTPKKEDEDIHL